MRSTKTGVGDGTAGERAGATHPVPQRLDALPGKILRITPIDFDADDAPPWTIEARGRRFTPPRKTTLASHGLAWRSLVYSPDRLLYPMRRVDFDPRGERHPENRGKSGYVRISWDEALDLVASEIRRVKTEHGPGAVTYNYPSHHSWGNVGYWTSALLRFFNAVGHTRINHNPDSWEGWFWGALHHWGNSMRLGTAEPYGTVGDLLKEAELIVFWSSDPESTSGIYAGYEGTVRRTWLKELGIPTVHIEPYLNATAAFLGGKWLAPRPGTDTALALALAQVWIAEGLYDKKFVAERTVGFGVWERYVTGADDGIPKTPEWQQAETGVPAREVRALAREWGTKRTYIAAGGWGNGLGGACRGPTGIQWARAMVCLSAMQGLGRPGVNFGNLQYGAPVDLNFYFPGYGEGGILGIFGVLKREELDLRPVANAALLGAGALARVAAVLRRDEVAGQEREVLAIGPLTLDRGRHEVTVDGVAVGLTAMEFRILAVMMAGNGRVLEREQLIDQVLGVGAAVTNRTIDVHIAALRKKLGAAAGWVQTVRGVGYTFRNPQSEPSEVES